MARINADLARLLRSASGTAALQAFSTLAAFVTSLLLARFLGATEYGRYAFAFAWAGLLGAFVTLGFDRYLVRGIATFEVKADWGFSRGLLRRTNQLVGAASVACAAIALAVGLATLPPSLQLPFAIAMALVPLTALTLVRQGAMQAFGHVVVGQMPEYLLRPLLIILGVLLLHLPGDALSASSALAVNVLAVATAFVVGALLLRARLPETIAAARPAYTTATWLRASLPMMAISGIWIVNNYVGTLVAGTFEGASAAGVFSLVQSGSAVIVIFLVATNMPLAPVIARLHASEDPVALERTTERVAQIGLAASLPVCIALAIFPGTFLSLFGPGFGSGATALTVVALCQIVNAASGPAGNVLIMTRHEGRAFWGIAAGATANLLLGLSLVPLMGVTGAGIALGLSIVLWNVLLVLIARRDLGVNVTAFGALALRRAGRQPR